ncbi:hypothetical protein SAMN05216411_11278 [Nitrosospira multiformis]|nr:hypothetical protein SAMN05216411_11278 [Nitrosospira multiformis]
MEVVGRTGSRAWRFPEMHNLPARSLLDKDPLARVFVYLPPAFYTWIQSMKIFSGSDILELHGHPGVSMHVTRRPVIIPPLLTL